jgi:hypothetical protein
MGFTWVPIGTSKDFGTHLIGSTTDQLFTFTAVDEEETVSDIKITISVPPYTVDPSSQYSIINDNLTGVTLGVGESGNFTVRFHPLSAGTFNNKLNVQNNMDYWIDLTGVGEAGPEPMTCWNLSARYKNSNRMYSINGGGDFPSELRIPGNVDLGTATVIEHGKQLNVSSLKIIQ